jgi:hypothetical protein
MKNTDGDFSLSSKEGENWKQQRKNMMHKEKTQWKMKVHE